MCFPRANGGKRQGVFGKGLDVLVDWCRGVWEDGFLEETFS